MFMPQVHWVSADPLWRGLTRLLAVYPSQRNTDDLNTFLEETMKAKSKGHVVGKGKADQTFTEFVNFTLPPEFETDIEEKFPNSDSVYTALEALIETGYKVTFSYRFDSQSVICSLTCRNEESVNHGKTLTSFAGSWYEALRVAVYKHFIALNSSWVEVSKMDTRPRFG